MALARRVGRLLGRPGAATRGSGKAGAGKPRVPIVDRGKFDVSVMAILKDEAPYMEEWLCHHMAIGVDHFFLYDNGSTDELHEILKPYADHGIVTTVYFPLRGLQRDANNHVVRFFGHTTEWLAYVDIDEFLVPEHDEQIGTVMSRFPDAQQVLVSRKEFCYSGHRSPPDGLVTQSYRMVSEQVPRMGSSDILAKPIIRPAQIARVGIHFALTVDDATFNTAAEPTQEDANNIERPSYANLQMNHYYTKSLEEFQAKRSRATTSTHSFLLPDVPFDIPAESDEAIDRWIPRTKAMMEKMRLVARSPSRYGSQLRMKGFPIADLFGTEATTVVSNEVAGLAEPRRKKSFNSLPLPGIRGALARAEDHGYEPAMGRFLASPHLVQEMAWLDAEVSWHLGLARPKLHIEDGTLDETDGRATIKFDAPSGSVTVPRGGPPWRCHALLFALEVAGPTGVEIAASKAGTWHTDVAFGLPEAGSYLGLIALEKKPRSIDAVRLDFSDATELTLYDLALLSFG